ncbi:MULTISPECIES: adenylyl-sulfate kinase [unclassified Pseudomonas]|uniref:adenylyl-sulfate kinase n=1 Tax=unclassified Pseudomonas TaxID=196821 RepID=UPI000BDB9C93|nr:MULTISPECIES: adenylyl-sulfate kinase [unclassified Pseudomonas]PVZ15619.1 adenylylsulfate kinase [Pseudomonas sp. URIL14HWK12:I12]PVZ24993.1 adenylylsulfate kinase [Pseudomonas sp. URIL14HWK12:I10]PVZ34839.1 adenylylsulfate kinase [Pseudomonas sp. URIL14HWK12:I11]SNZ09423.1 adenylylsulfate kinase [Pseudomonas sp. URIL14HWK12:I9]
MNDLSQAGFIHPFSLAVQPWQRAALKGQRGRCIWLTGYSGAGKSTLAAHLEAALLSRGRHTFVLDGDNVRAGLCQDLGMSPEERRENIRRMAEVARLMVDAGLIVIVAAISPFEADRQAARALFDDQTFFLVHVSTSLKECARRDPKGLYRAAREGRVRQFTGVDSPYEAPPVADYVIDTTQASLEHCTQRLTQALLAG